MAKSNLAEAKKRTTMSKHLGTWISAVHLE
jgi:hypothetical protein